MTLKFISIADCGFKDAQLLLGKARCFRCNIFHFTRLHSSLSVIHSFFNPQWERASLQMKQARPFCWSFKMIPALTLSNVDARPCG
jgi:hypothetical protein